MQCPKCGFAQQDGLLECGRCGVIFARWSARAAQAPTAHTAEASGNFSAVSPGLLRRGWRVMRWVSLAGLIAVTALVLRATPAPNIVTNRDAVERAEAKVQEFQSLAGRGYSPTLELNESELNGWLGANLAIAPPPQADGAPTNEHLGETQATVEEVQSSVRAVKVELKEDSLRAHTLFDLHGVELSLELEGALTVRDGYLRFEPTSGKLGSLPLLAGTLQSATARLFDSEENKEKFRLPSHIRDVRIERAQLVVSSR